MVLQLPNTDSAAVRRADALLSFEAAVPNLVDTYIRQTHSLGPDDCYAVLLTLSCRALTDDDDGGSAKDTAR